MNHTTERSAEYYHTYYFSFICFMYMHVWPTCNMYHTHGWCLQRPRKGIRYPGTGVTKGCELLCGCWDPYLNPLQEQQVFLTSEPTPQP